MLFRSGAGARVIGHSVPESRYTVTWQGETLVDCEVQAITTGRAVERPSRRRERALPPRSRRRAPDVHKALLTLLKGLHLGSREYLTAHYDGDVQGRTWLRAGEGDASVIRVRPDRPTGLAFAVGGNPFWCAGDPALGAAHAVAEAARNVAVTGARPWALTDCLNFGHPEDPEVMGDLEACIDGLAAAAQSLGALASSGQPLPFVSGNVSLYNQVGRDAIPPSPIVMCAGVLRDVRFALGQGLRSAGHVLVMVGDDRDGLDGSTYRREVLREESGMPPALDLAAEARLQTLAVTIAEEGLAVAGHDVSDGGLAITVTEMMLGAPDTTPLGVELDLEPLGAEAAVALFCERPAIVYEVPFERLTRLSQTARDHGFVAWPIGTVSAQPSLRVRVSGETTLAWTREELVEARGTALRALWNEEAL